MVIVRFSRDSGYPQKGNPTFLGVSSGDVAQVVYVDDDGEWAFAG